MIYIFLFYKSNNFYIYMKKYKFERNIIDSLILNFNFGFLKLFILNQKDGKKLA